MVLNKLILAGAITIAGTGLAAAEPVTVAMEYLDALEASDLDAAEKLFHPQSSIFEGGSQEGSWKDYREHHLGPEIDSVKQFAITRGEAVSGQSDDGSLAFVAIPIEYLIELESGDKFDSSGMVTFVLSKVDGVHKIRHLHWSSRRKR